MSLFGSIMSKIFGHAEAAGSQPPSQPGAENQTEAASPAQTGAAASGQAGSAPSGGAGSSAAQAAARPVDVEAVLTAMASQKGGGGNWQTSIVDLLKLLDLDSSLTARKELGNELGVHAGADGSAEQNIALHKAVMQKLAENGGKVPETLKG